MKRFTINGYFEADDIDDAFRCLAEHFAALADEGELPDLLSPLGAPLEIVVEPTDGPNVP